MYKLSVVSVPCTPSWNWIVSRVVEEAEEAPCDELEAVELELLAAGVAAAGEEPLAGLLPLGVELDSGGSGFGATWITHFLMSPVMRANRLWDSVPCSITSRPACVWRICKSMAMYTAPRRTTLTNVAKSISSNVKP